MAPRFQARPWLSEARRQRTVTCGLLGVALIVASQIVDGGVPSQCGAGVFFPGVVLTIIAGVTAWRERSARREQRRTGFVEPDPVWTSPERQRAVRSALAWSLGLWLGAAFSTDEAWLGGLSTGAVAFLALAAAWRWREGRARRRRDQAEADAARRGWLTPEGFDQRFSDLAARLVREGDATDSVTAWVEHYRKTRERLAAAGVSDGRLSDLERRERVLQDLGARLTALRDDMLKTRDRLAAEHDAAPTVGENPGLRAWLDDTLQELDRREGDVFEALAREGARQPPPRLLTGEESS